MFFLRSGWISSVIFHQRSLAEWFPHVIILQVSTYVIWDRIDVRKSGIHIPTFFSAGLHPPSVSDFPLFAEKLSPNPPWSRCELAGLACWWQSSTDSRAERRAAPLDCKCNVSCCFGALWCTELSSTVDVSCVAIGADYWWVQGEALALFQGTDAKSCCFPDKQRNRTRNGRCESWLLNEGEI